MQPDQRIKIAIATVVIFVGMISHLICFGDGPESPITKLGKPWRIAYYEGGPYTDYGDCMRAILSGLMEGVDRNRTVASAHRRYAQTLLELAG